MTVFQVQIPESVDINEFDLKMLIASKLFEDGKLSSGQAAEIVGISKRAFIEVLGQYNSTVFGYDFQEIQEDLNNA